MIGVLSLSRTRICSSLRAVTIRILHSTKGMADNEYVVEYAKTGRSGCKKCKEKIGKGAARIGKETSSPFGDDGKMTVWYHVECMFDALKRARATTKKIETTHDLKGFDLLDRDEQDDVKRLISAFAGGAASTPKKTQKKAGKTGLGGAGESVGGKASKGTFSEESIETDNSFRQFRRLCEKIEAESSHNRKSQQIADYLQMGNSGDGFHGDPYLLLKLLLPGEVKRIYNLKNRQLVKLFSQIFQCDVSDMADDLDQQGEVSETISSFFCSSESVQPKKKSTLSLSDVDQMLDELKGVTKEEEQEKILKKITLKCTAKDLKYIVRLIKHDLRMNAGASLVLDGLDPQAYKAFNSSHDLQAVVRRVWNQKTSGVDLTAKASSVLDVSISLMTPVKPMLASACKSSSAAIKKCPNGLYAEIKYDGERVQIHKRGTDFSYYSRSLKTVLPHKVEHVKSFLPQACPHGHSMILDAEVLLMDTKEKKPLPFGSLSIHKKHAFKDATVCLFIFDCLLFNGENLMDKPLVERRKLLEKNLTVIPNRIMMSELHRIRTETDLDDLMRRAMREGLEGLVLKDVNGVYEPNRRHWLKMKKDYLAEGAMADTADLVVLGAYYGTGSKGGLMSVFLMGVRDEESNTWKTVCKCGNGHDESTMLKLQKQLSMTKIGKDYSKIPSWLNVHRSLTPDFIVTTPQDGPVWEITGAEFSSSTTHTAAGISIRFPRVTRIRDDKDWKTATTLSELKTLFQESKKTSTDGEPSLFHTKQDEGTDDEPPPKKAKVSVRDEEVPENDLPCFFRGMTFYFPPSLDQDKTAKLRRYIIAYDGDVTDEHEKEAANFVVVAGKSQKSETVGVGQKEVTFEWVWKCIEHQKIVRNS
eukprot:m.54141 g.54141  ORF g.54141 m.54141 type:complete len:870 (+) comp34313_c0_seq13:36-2645(+)